MKDKIFIDTNVLIYLYSEDETAKQNTAFELLNKYDNLIISSQVINEVSNVLFKKFKLTSKEVKSVLTEIDNVFDIVGFDLVTQIKAIQLKSKYNLQFNDSLIIATALENNCTILYSEDMQNGINIDDSLKIINPFFLDK